MHKCINVQIVCVHSLHFKAPPRCLRPVHPACLFPHCLCCRQVCQQGFLAQSSQNILILMRILITNILLPILKQEFLALLIPQKTPLTFSFIGSFNCASKVFPQIISYSLSGPDSAVQFCPSAHPSTAWKVKKFTGTRAIISNWCPILPSLALMVWLCGLHTEDVCVIADAIPNRLFYQVSHEISHLPTRTDLSLSALWWVTSSPM